jgi:hypothetical protein
MILADKHMDYEVNLEEYGVYLRFYGIVSYEGLLACRARLWETPEWDNICYEILDFRDASSLHITSTNTKIMASMDDVATISSRRKKVAIIANHSDFMRFAHSYINAKKRQRWEAQVFDDLDTGRCWVSA